MRFENSHRTAFGAENAASLNLNWVTSDAPKISAAATMSRASVILAAADPKDVEGRPMPRSVVDELPRFLAVNIIDHLLS